MVMLGQLMRVQEELTEAAEAANGGNDDGAFGIGVGNGGRGGGGGGGGFLSSSSATAAAVIGELDDFHKVLMEPLRRLADPRYPNRLVGFDIHEDTVSLVLLHDLARRVREILQYLR